nr:hypothetical protein [Tanacetum cinerariifolium]
GFIRDIYGDHNVSCTGIVGIKHRHNIMCDTLVDICFRSGISAGKEVDIRLGGGRDKPLSPADMLLYSWDEGLDVFVDLIEADAVTLLKQIQKFFMAQDVGAHDVVHIFNRISFTIAKGVRAQMYLGSLLIYCKSLEFLIK